MTAIAYFWAENRPMFVGDLLVSAPEVEGAAALEIPTRRRGDIPFPPGSGYVPVELRQKIVVVAPYLVVGWSGSYVHARHLIADLTNFVSITQRGFSEIQRFLTSYDSSVLSELSLLGAINHGTQFQDFGLNSQSVPVEAAWGNERHIGTGGEILYEAITQFRDRGYRIDQPPDSETDRMRLFSVCAGLISNLFRAEISTNVSLLNYFGGGFELCGFSGPGIFEKLSGVTFFIWDLLCTFDNPSTYSLQIRPVRAIRYVYNGNVLHIRSAQLSHHGTGVLRIDSDRMFLVKPLLSQPVYETSDHISLTSPVVCHHLGLSRDGRQLIAGITANVFLNDPDAAIRLIGEDGNQVEYSINNEKLHSVVRPMIEQITEFIRRGQ